MQLSCFFRQEEFDELQFCRYYLRLVLKLRDLENAKVSRFRFSKAFSKFTMLVYYNLFGDHSPKQSQRQQQKTKRQNAGTKNPSALVYSSSPEAKSNSFKRNQDLPDEKLWYVRQVTFGSQGGNEAIDEAFDKEKKCSNAKKLRIEDLEIKSEELH